MSYRYYYHTSSKDGTLCHSHYSDPAFKNEAVIFGKKEDELIWNYADRLWGWDRDKADAAWEFAVKQHGKNNTARRIETYLKHYFNDESIDLVVVVSGTQPFNGYPWFAYGHKQDTPAPAGQESKT